jgi:AAA family ATP:ADP antiporter
MGYIAMIGTTPVMLAVIFGAAQNIMSKSAKYSLFDPTKEMAYIPLDQEQKVKGKAAIDVVGARLGKSGGAVIQQVLVVTLGTITAYTPYVAGILLLIIAAWMYAVRSLNKQFIDLTKTPTGGSGGTDKESASSMLAHSKVAVSAK